MRVQRSWWLRQAARICFAAGFVSLLSLLILAKCGLQDIPIPTPGHQGTKEQVTEGKWSSGAAQATSDKEEIARLYAQISQLKNTIKLLTHGSFGNGSQCYRRGTFEESHAINNEYEVNAFSHFTVHRIYPTELGLGKRVVEKPIGGKRKDLNEVVEGALEEINKNRTVKYNKEDFVEGIYRNEPGVGAQYQLYLKDKESKGGYLKVEMVRWLGPAAASQASRVTPKRQLIHVVVTATAGLDTFLDKFYRIGLKVDRHVALSVVGGRPPAGRLPHAVRFVNSTEAALSTPWPPVLPSQHLMLLCDSHVVFSAKFLERCRWNAAAGSSVYYPIAFSLYNPYLVYTLQGKKIPPENDQLFISRDTGFWRDFAYSISCQYKADWLNVGGLEKGDELTVYRRHLRSGIKVIRATDPGIFYLWHPKECKRKGSEEKYKACVRSKALHEGSHAQIGLLLASTNLTTYHNTPVS